MEEQNNIRLEKLEKIRAAGIEPYPYEYRRSHSFSELIEAHGQAGPEELEKAGFECRVAGRIVARRDMGKSTFMHLFDGRDKMQVYLRRESVRENDLLLLKLLDIGDFIGVAGRLFKTRTGELTVMVSEMTLLSKSLHPLPEKWHGLQDKELRYRKRYLDLIGNEEARQAFQLRFSLIRGIREFFFARDYLEVETPMMQPIPGGASARPFVTHHNALNMELFLRIAPELYLKRLLVGGMEKVFEINRNFRNEGISQMHNPEFTMIEFYELYRDFNYYMDLTEELFAFLNEKLAPKGLLTTDGRPLNLQPPFPRKRFMELLAEAGGVEEELFRSEAGLDEFIRSRFPDTEFPSTYGRRLDSLFSMLVEEKLQQPTFVTHHPKVISPLAKESRDDARDTERFELYVAGMEIANGFSELNDPLEQRRRFAAQLADRERGDDEAQLLDESFLESLEHGMAPAAGEGIGIDRLVMVYSGMRSIREVILFPLLRTRESE